MKQSVDRNTFVKAFDIMGRSSEFTPYAREVLFDYLEELENDLGEEIKLDVIAICCDYTQYENIEEYNKEYGTEFESFDEVLESGDVCTVLEVGDGAIVSNH